MACAEYVTVFFFIELTSDKFTPGLFVIKLINDEFTLGPLQLGVDLILESLFQ